MIKRVLLRLVRDLPHTEKVCFHKSVCGFTRKSGTFRFDSITWCIRFNINSLLSLSVLTSNEILQGWGGEGRQRKNKLFWQGS